jgi:putative transposase
MKKSRFTEAQIIAALKQVEAGRTVDDVARECGVSQITIYTCKANRRHRGQRSAAAAVAGG